MKYVVCSIGFRLAQFPLLKLLRLWILFSIVKSPLKGISRDSNMTWFFSPIESTDTNCALLAHKAALFHSRESPFRESVLFSGSLGWSWVIIRIEIKMESGALLPSNLPSVIDRSNLSPSREFLFLKHLLENNIHFQQAIAELYDSSVKGTIARNKK